jgi:pSer/pThr/pTyr-binding forkhead associated (FHA) protein
MLDQSLRGGRVAEWHKSEEETIGFGDDVCTVVIDDFAVLRRTARATLLSSSKKDRLVSDLESRTGRVEVAVKLTASESGILRQILKQRNDVVTVGETLALVATDVGDSVDAPGNFDTAPLMRVVGNMISQGKDL